MRQVLLDQIGGEAALQRLITQFYGLMESLPEVYEIHRLHFRGHGLGHTREAQIEFLSGFMGGWTHYRERHGHMDLREIHAHVPIRDADAESWPTVMDRALRECGHEGAHTGALQQTLRRAALMLVNKVPDWRKAEAP